MGGAKFLGASVSMPRGKIERAFECFFYWMAGGLFISFALTVIMNLHGILAEPNFLIPIGFYVFVAVLLFCRFLYFDFKGEDETKTKKDVAEEELVKKQLQKYKSVK